MLPLRSRWCLMLLALLPMLAQAVAAPDATLDEIDRLLLIQRTQPDAAKFERARALAEQASVAFPDDARAWLALAWVRLIDHRFTAALAATQTALAQQPDHPRALILQSDALVELGRYPAAEQVTQRLLDIAPGIPAWVRAAHLRFLFNDPAGAVELMSMAAHAGAGGTEEAAWVWLDLARLHLDTGDLSAAAAAIANAQLAYPGLPAIVSAQARLLHAKGEDREALARCDEALAGFVNAEDALLAWQLARKLNAAGAIKHHAALLEAIDKLDTGGRSRRALALYHAANGNASRALQLAREELAARPDIYSEATLARVLDITGNSRQARRHALAALALKTPDPQLQADMGAILDKQRNAPANPVAAR